MAQHIVKPNEYLSGIASIYGTTVGDIATLNGISNPNMIYAGQVLNIPGAAGSAPTTNTADNVVESSSGGNFIGNSDVTKSQELIDAEALLNQHMQNRPGEYQSEFTEQLEMITNSVLNREPFSYDFNADPIYQQYKDQYTTLGEKAMRDTMGNAAALTGGYGNSYASTAGNQAYQAYLQQLNNIIPELYRNAYEMDQNELAALYQQAGLLQGLEADAYGKWSDGQNAYMDELKFLTDRVDTLTDRDYAIYQDAQQALKGSGGGGGGGYYSAPQAEEQTNTDTQHRVLLQQLEAQARNASSDYLAYYPLIAAYKTGAITIEEAEKIISNTGGNFASAWAMYHDGSGIYN